MISFCSSIIIISSLAQINDLIKVPGVYKDNTIIYTTLTGESIELKDTTINLYEENEKLYVYYHEDDVRNIETSTLIELDLKNSLMIIFYIGTPWIICLVLYIKKLKTDKNIIKYGKHIHINITQIEKEEDKIGKYITITANYIDENNKKYSFISNKIYNKKQIEEIKETGSVHIYYMTNMQEKYIVYEYSKRATIDWIGK
jgi:hypothetical protein